MDYWITFCLAFIAIGLAIITFLALQVPDSEILGGFLFAIGMMHVVFYKRTGRRFYATTQSGWRYVAEFWVQSGEKGTQTLFLGMGIIFAAAGGILLVAASFGSR